MNRASRIKLARELLCCAKMVLKYNKTIVADGSYDRFKQYIAQNYNMLDDTYPFDIKDVKSGYVAHHFRGNTHYIQLGKPAEVYKIYMNILKGVDNCLLKFYEKL